jgi:hypothetical protein
MREFLIHSIQKKFRLKPCIWVTVKEMKGIEQNVTTRIAGSNPFLYVCIQAEYQCGF